ncbi:hypothetical protein AB6A40_008139 [Gnathostoma spinigerum]|uniref:SCP domain-containing protein n=1 Tax=Gnathostoma spinigerum TaxID=75299 RepID=A0ABD6EPG4_9BILA
MLVFVALPCISLLSFIIKIAEEQFGMQPIDTCPTHVLDDSIRYALYAGHFRYGWLLNGLQVSTHAMTPSIDELSPMKYNCHLEDQAQLRAEHCSDVKDTSSDERYEKIYTATKEEQFKIDEEFVNMAIEAWLIDSNGEANESYSSDVPTPSSAVTNTSQARETARSLSVAFLINIYLTFSA